MKQEQQVVFSLISVANGGEVRSLPESVDWQKVYDFACQQGVACLVFDGLETLHKKMGTEGIPQEFILQLYGRKQQVVKQMQEMQQVAMEFGEQMSPMQGFVLKGMDFAQYWPNPLYREYGDFDCYYSCEFDKVNERAAEIGAEVEHATHKHSHIHYKGLMIENHQTFTDYDGTRTGKRTEQRLTSLLACEKIHSFGHTDLLSPNPTFTVCFMLKHAQMHFMTEGIELRHFLDWMYFIDRCGDKLDRERVVRLLDEMKLTNFAAMMTEYCVSRFNWRGLEIQKYRNTAIQKPAEESSLFIVHSSSSKLLERIDEFVFSEKADVQNKNVWYRSKRILRRFVRAWHFRKLHYLPYHKAVWTWIAYASTLDRKPVPSASEK